jgi:predicted nucleic acid-binding protein
MGRRSRRDAAETNLIVVDTSAWVELLRATGSPVHRALRALVESGEALAVTEMVVMELLAGAGRADVRPLRSRMLAFDLLPLGGLRDFERAVGIYRECRSAGEEIRSLTDCLIAVPAIHAGASVLHADRDFDAIARHTDLSLHPVEPT